MSQRVSFLTSRRMGAVQPPIIPIVGEMVRNRPGTISLGQGVAYYGPPPGAIESLRDFLAEPQNHRYGAAQGHPRLLRLIEEKLAAENHITADQGYRVLVTAGANMGFLNALFAITDPGDEVILPLPYYFNQEMAVRMLNCQRYRCRPLPITSCSRSGCAGRLRHARARS